MTEPSEELDPFELFETKKLERMLNGSLKSAIDAHGPIDKNLTPSASKRFVNTFRTYLKQFTSQKLLDDTTNRLIQAANSSALDLRMVNDRIKKQNIYLTECLRKLRDGEATVEQVDEFIHESRQIKKGKECQTNSPLKPSLSE